MNYSRYARAYKSVPVFPDVTQAVFDAMSLKEKINFLRLRKEDDFSPYLGGIYFEGKSLHNIDFSGMEIEDVIFDGSEFTEAKFINNARLRDVDFYGAKNLASCTFNTAEISESLFANINNTFITFNNVDFTKTQFIECEIQSSIFRKCDMDGVIFEGCGLDEVQFVNCKNTDSMTFTENTGKVRGLPRPKKSLLRY
jgi:uncharacterized protein YjbI with pentapeptide repeats